MAPEGDNQSRQNERGSLPLESLSDGAPQVSRSKGPVSLHTVERLSMYRRMLDELAHEGVESIHSHQLAAMVGVTPAQLRRDLASFGSFGNIARGYDVQQMSRTISQIIGTDEPTERRPGRRGRSGQSSSLLPRFRGTRLPYRCRLRRRPGEDRAGVRGPPLLLARASSRRSSPNSISASSSSLPGPKACRRWSTGRRPSACAAS